MKTFYSFPSLDFKEQRLIWEEVAYSKMESTEASASTVEASIESATDAACMSDTDIKQAEDDIQRLLTEREEATGKENLTFARTLTSAINDIKGELSMRTFVGPVQPAEALKSPLEPKVAKTESTTAPSPAPRDDFTPPKQEAVKKDEVQKDDKKETKTTAEALEEAGVDAKTAQRIAEDTETALKDGKEGKEGNEMTPEQMRDQIATKVAENKVGLSIFKQLKEQGADATTIDLAYADGIASGIAMDPNGLGFNEDQIAKSRPDGKPFTTQNFIDLVIEKAEGTAPEKTKETKVESKESIEDDKKREARLYQEVRGDGKKENMKTVNAVIDQKLQEIGTIQSQNNAYTPKRLDLQKDIDTLKALEGKTKKLANDVDEKIRDMGQDIKDLDQADFADQLNVFTVEHDGSLAFKIKPQNGQEVKTFVKAQLGEKASKAYEGAVKEVCERIKQSANQNPEGKNRDAKKS
jgi:hypothetical protein